MFSFPKAISVPETHPLLWLESEAMLPQRTQPHSDLDYGCAEFSLTPYCIFQVVSSRLCYFLEVQRKLKLG